MQNFKLIFHIYTKVFGLWNFILIYDKYRQIMQRKYDNITL